MGTNLTEYNKLITAYFSLFNPSYNCDHDSVKDMGTDVTQSQIHWNGLFFPVMPGVVGQVCTSRTNPYSPSHSCFTCFAVRGRIQKIRKPNNILSEFKFTRSVHPKCSQSLQLIFQTERRLIATYMQVDIEYTARVTVLYVHPQKHQQYP